MIIVQTFYGLCRCETLKWEQDFIDDLYSMAESDTVKKLVGEIIFIVSGEKEGDLETALLQLVEIMPEIGSLDAEIDKISCTVIKLLKLKKKKIDIALKVNILFKISIP